MLKKDLGKREKVIKDDKTKYSNENDVIFYMIIER
jgi:hypothetical protein